MSKLAAFVPATVYADFADPRSYVASLRFDALLSNGHPSLLWKPVQHRPTLPRDGVRLDESAHGIRGAELRQAYDTLVLGERCDARNPNFLPHTGVASTVYAAAVEFGVGPQVRRLLFDAYWVGGKDIGDSDTLRLLTGPFLDFDDNSEIGIHKKMSAHRVARGWQQEWLKMGTPVQLTVVSSQHSAEYGTAALSRLRPERQFAA